MRFVRKMDDYGEPSWIRTSDLLIKSQLLYQLSYGPALSEPSLRHVYARGQGAHGGVAWINGEWDRATRGQSRAAA